MLSPIDQGGETPVGYLPGWKASSAYRSREVMVPFSSDQYWTCGACRTCVRCIPSFGHWMAFPAAQDVLECLWTSCSVYYVTSSRRHCTFKCGSTACCREHLRCMTVDRVEVWFLARIRGLLICSVPEAGEPCRANILMFRQRPRRYTETTKECSRCSGRA